MTQDLLVEAHDILNCGSAVFEANELDHFDDMTNLDKTFQRKSLTWHAVLEAVVLGRKLLTSRLGKCQRG